MNSLKRIAMFPYALKNAGVYTTLNKHVSFFGSINESNAVHELAHAFDESTEDTRFMQEHLGFSKLSWSSNPFKLFFSKSVRAVDFHTPFVSYDKERASFARDYGRANPSEDFATSIQAFVHNPEELKKNAPEKYVLIRDKVFAGREYGGAKDITSTTLPHALTERFKNGGLERILLSCLKQIPVGQVTRAPECVDRAFDEAWREVAQNSKTCLEVARGKDELRRLITDVKFGMSYTNAAGIPIFYRNNCLSCQNWITDSKPFEAELKRIFGKQHSAAH